MAGVNVIIERSSGFLNSSCLLYELLKTEDEGNTIPTGQRGRGGEMGRAEGGGG